MCATLAPADMILANSAVLSRGDSFAKGPVSVSKVPAEKGQLIFMLSGNRSLVEKIQPYLAQMGKASHFVGEEAGSANKMEVSRQLYIEQQVGVSSGGDQRDR